MADLPAGKQAGVSSIGSLVSPSGSSSNDDTSDDGGSVWGKVGKLLPGVGGVLGALFGQKQTDNVTPQINKVNKGADALNAQGKQLFGTGTDALGPVLKYFQALSSGDPSAALAATQPQRGRVIDQYDAARKSAGQFGPRGGGGASSELELRGKEAGQLADTTSQARSEGATQLASLGKDITQQGLSAEETANQQMASVLQPLLEQQKQHAESTGGFWKGLGDLAGAAIGLL
jgi:hypothetical protein